MIASKRTSGPRRQESVPGMTSAYPVTRQEGRSLPLQFATMRGHFPETGFSFLLSG
jgi:hypothetical protein